MPRDSEQESWAAADALCEEAHASAFIIIIIIIFFNEHQREHLCSLWDAIMRLVLVFISIGIVIIYDY